MTISGPSSSIFTSRTMPRSMTDSTGTSGSLISANKDQTFAAGVSAICSFGSIFLFLAPPPGRPRGLPFTAGIGPLQELDFRQEIAQVFGMSALPAPCLHPKLPVILAGWIGDGGFGKYFSHFLFPFHPDRGQIDPDTLRRQQFFA